MTIRGEYMRSLLSCVIITFILFISASSQAKCGATEGEVGFFLREHTSCFVSNADGSGRRKCGEGCGLAPGDIITVDPAIAANQFDIKWVSGHARIELIFPNNYKVFYDPPQNRHKIVAAVQEMLGFTHERMQRWTITTATRKTNDTGNAQLPGSVSTLMNRIPEFQPAAEKHQTGQQFHNEITRRDGHAAVFAATLQRQPRHQRDVQPPRDGIFAMRTVRRRRDDAHAQRQPVDADVQEAPHDAAEHDEAQRPEVERHEGPVRSPRSPVHSQKHNPKD